MLRPQPPKQRPFAFKGKLLGDEQKQGGRGFLFGQTGELFEYGVGLPRSRPAKQQLQHTGILLVQIVYIRQYTPFSRKRKRRVLEKGLENLQKCHIPVMDCS